jgi:regulator of replication initiation timing
MNFDNILQIIVPVATAVIGWLAGRQKKKNDFLGDLQQSINLLSDENSKLQSEVVTLRNENTSLKTELHKLQTQFSTLENKVLPKKSRKNGSQ